MRDSKELRIGNLFVIHGEYHRVYGIIESGIVEVGKNKAGYAIEYINPIPLTPKILVEACGFEAIRENVFFFTKEGVNPVTCEVTFISKKTLAVRVSERLGIDLRGSFVRNHHELQNIYYALTKTELPIKVDNLKTV